MSKVENLTCPTCAGQLVTDGRAWVECACGYRHGAFVKPLGDGTFSAKLRSGGRKPVSRKKMPVNGRMYDDDLRAIEARGYTVQRILDEGVARVLAGGWMPINQDGPPPDTAVLVTDGVNVWSARCVRLVDLVLWSAHGCTAHDMDAEFEEPTHWMPLPSAKG